MLFDSLRRTFHFGIVFRRRAISDDDSFDTSRLADYIIGIIIDLF